MHIFSVSRTKPNGMDDVDVNQLSDSTPVVMYKKFFGEKIYDWKHSTEDIFSVSFKVKDITLCYGGGYRVWCEISSLNYRGERKIDSSKMNILQSVFKKQLSEDFSLFSINDVDIVILNRDTFEIVEKKSLDTLKGGYEFYHKSVSKYSIYSFKEDLTKSNKFWKI